MKFTYLLVVATCFLFQNCAHSNVEGPLIATESIDSIQETQEYELEPEPEYIELIQRDAQNAALILKNAIETEVGVKAAFWASVYSNILGIKSDELLKSFHIMRGTYSEDLVERVLAWRWIAELEEFVLPEVIPEPGEEPVLDLFIYIALHRRSRFVDKWEDAVNAGTIETVYEDVSGVVFLEPEEVLAIDNGVLELAMHFTRIRRQNVGIKVDGVVISQAARLRHQLFFRLGIPFDEKEVSDFSKEFMPSGLFKLLESPFARTPLDSLRGMCVRGSIDTQIKALRMLGVAVHEPVALDFAAAAAAMQSEVEIIRVEAARTYLMLVKKAQE